MADTAPSPNKVDFAKRSLFVSELLRKSVDLGELLARLRRSVLLATALLAVSGCSTRVTVVPSSTPALASKPPTSTSAPLTPTAAPLTPTSEPPLIGTLVQSESQCSLDAAEAPVMSGRVAINIVNETDSVVRFDMWRLDEGYPYEQFQVLIEKERQRAEENKPGLGPPSRIGNLKQFIVLAGASESIVRNLSPGTYAIVCFRVFDQAGVRPFALVGPLEVEG